MNNTQYKQRTSGKRWDPLCPPANIVPLERDTMPREVATAMLLEPKAKLSARQRKTCNEARWTVYTSSRVPISEENKTARRLKSRTWQQILTQLRRLREARATAQRHFVFLQRQSNKLDSRNPEHAGVLSVLSRQMAALDLHAAGLDALTDAVQSEIQRRQKFIAALKEVVPSVANKIEPELVGVIA